MKFFQAFLHLGFAAVFTADLQAGKADEMDYGPFLSATFVDLAPRDDQGRMTEGRSTLTGAERIACNKGVAVKFGTGEGGMIFDTELLRMTAGWTNRWLTLKGVAFDGKHGPNPTVAEDAEIFFGTRANGPGWSKGEDFTDPRKLPIGENAAKVPLGPLPAEWGKYRGLYVSGERVIFSYSVGEAHVLELPALETVGKTVLLTRTFNITKTGAGSRLRIADLPPGSELKMADGIATISEDDPRDPQRISRIRVIGLPSGSKLIEQSGSVVLQLPQLTAGIAFKVVYARGTNQKFTELAEAIGAAAEPSDLLPWTEGGATRWPQPIVSAGTLAGDESAAYVLDQIAVPFVNPFKSWMRFAALDFFPDGRAAVSTWSGDVWIVSGLNDDLRDVRWKRYASGLFHPLGLEIVGNQIHVLGRDQITRLQDLNADGEADFYENFNNDVQITPNFHEFTFDLQTDSRGNFYFTKGGPVNPGGRGWGPLSDHHGCVFKLSPDGQKLEVFATGVRAPNGLGIGPNDEITVSDNEGTWVPACYLHWLKAGDFVSVVDLAHRPEPPTKPGAHLCFFPISVDNSSSGQVWVQGDRWGPLRDRLLHLSYGKSGLFGVLMEQVGDVKQAAAFRFPLKFETGAMRARFNPADGQLYVIGLKGWQTDGTKDAGFQRVRFTGKPVHLPAAMHVTDRGFRLSFTTELQAESAMDPASYSVELWNYRWSKEYGSADYKVERPEEKGRDTVELKSVELSPDRKSVLIEVPGLKPVDQYRIRLNLKAADGTALPGEITGTINAVAADAAPGTALPSSR
jgi:hypothetical protein